MTLLDTNEYLRRSHLIDELSTQHPHYLMALTPAERDTIESYYLAVLDTDNPDEYRRGRIKADPLAELKANHAYEHFLSAAGVPEVLTEPQP